MMTLWNITKNTKVIHAWIGETFWMRMVTQSPKAPIQLSQTFRTVVQRGSPAPKSAPEEMRWIASNRR